MSISEIVYGLTGCGPPSIARVASVMKLQLSVFETNGNERLARRLHSITLTSLPRARNWMLKGPVMLSDLAICDADALDLLDRRDVQLLGGQHERRVARVHARVLDVLRDGVVEHGAVLRDRVELDLLRVG